MRFKEFLLEDRTSVFAEVRPISSEELHLIKQAQGVASIIHFAIKKGSKITVPEVIHIRREMEKYVDEFKFLKRSIMAMDTWLEAHEKMSGSHEHLQVNKDEIKDRFAKMKDAFLSNDTEEMEKHSKKLKKLIEPADAHINVSKQAKLHFERTYKNSITIFGTTRLLHHLDEKDYEQIEAIDTSKHLYTGLDFPMKKLKDDWDYIVYFLTHLSTQNEPLQFGPDSHDFRQFMQVKMDGNSKFKKLRDLMASYLSNNDKDLIPEILELIEAIPQIKEANDKRKKQIKKVYRGLGFGDDAPSEHEIIEEDRKERYVATSDSLYAAKNFALQKGHLEHDDQRRSTHGVILEYTVNPGAILFDTEVIDSKFNESEILIDATKAVVTKVRDV